jgi:hypothetical protein
MWISALAAWDFEWEKLLPRFLSEDINFVNSQKINFWINLIVIFSRIKANSCLFGTE